VADGADSGEGSDDHRRIVLGAPEVATFGAKPPAV
jgi:hypothetical protein